MAKKDWMSEDLGERHSRKMEQQMQKLRRGQVSKNSRNYHAEGWVHNEACTESCGAPKWRVSTECFWLQVRRDSTPSGYLIRVGLSYTSRIQRLGSPSIGCLSLYTLCFTLNVVDDTEAQLVVLKHKQHWVPDFVLLFMFLQRLFL